MLRSSFFKIAIGIIAFLMIFHLAVGFFISPLFKPWIINKASQQIKARVNIDEFNFWPLTLSVSLKGVKVSDTRVVNDVIFQADAVSAYLNPMGILKNQLILSRVSIDGAKIILKKEWISKITQSLRRGALKDSAAAEQESAKEDNRVAIGNVKIGMGDVRVVDNSLRSISGFNMTGDLMINGLDAGSLSFKLLDPYVTNEPKLSFAAELKQIDLKPLRFIYQEAIPVEVLRGKFDLISRVALNGRNISSQNSLSLINHELAAKENQEEEKGFMPLPMICATLNKINPVNLDFEVGGTLEKPEFKGFQKSLMNLVMSNTQVFQEQLINKGFEALGEYLQKRKKKKEGDAVPPSSEVPPPPTETVPPAPTQAPPQDAQPQTVPEPVNQPAPDSAQPAADTAPANP